MPFSNAEHQLAAFTMTLLRCGERYLMLKRADDKAFAPGRWTGLGGKVESGEFDNLNSAALREIFEEAGVESRAIEHFTLRRSLLQQRPGHPVTVLLYFTGEVTSPVTSECDEGTLHWLSKTEIGQIDVIENTSLVIPLLIQDMTRDPAGTSALIPGSASFSTDGEITSIVWAEAGSGF